MKTSVKKFTAFILAITLTLPFMVFATAQDEKATSDGPDIAYEMPEMRNEYEKHFLMSDGTAVAATYAEPVNYYDISDNTWKEIDNTLTLKNGRYQNKGHGGFDVSFRGENDTGDLVKITVDEHTLSWNVSVQNVLGTKDTLKRQVSATVSRNQDTQNNKFAAKNAGASIKYNSPFSGNKLIDVNYTVSQYKVKEDIAIYSPKDGNAIYYTYNCGELTAVLNKDNSIDFIDKAGNPIYTVHSPYMYDAAGNGSHSFRITLKQTDDMCTVVMTPDKEWLNSAARVYPVVIDPTVTSLGETRFDDTYIHSGDSAGDHYLQTKMTVGKYGGIENKGLLKLERFPTMSYTGVNIISVQLVLSIAAKGTMTGTFTLTRISSAWNEETVSYSNIPSLGSVLDNNVPMDIDSNTVTFDIMEYLQKIRSGTWTNNGFLITYNDPTYNGYCEFYTGDYNNSSYHPMYLIHYSLLQETESNNTFATADQLEVMPQAGVITTVNGANTPSGTTIDYDYYKFIAPRHGRIEVRLTVLGNGIYNVAAYDESQNSLAAAPAKTLYTNPDGTQSREGNISFTTTKDGDKNGSLDTYYIRVYGPTSSSLSYRLTIKYTTAYAAFNWQYPLPVGNKYITSPVGYRTYDNDYHEGVDIIVAEDNNVYAVTDAVVIFSAFNGKNKTETERGEGMGEYIVLFTDQANGDVDPANGYYFAITYMHLNTRNVSVGNPVEQGTIIGKSGDTGGSTGPHLHFAVFVHPTRPNQATAYNDQRYNIINPYEFFYDDISFTGTPY